MRLNWIKDNGSSVSLGSMSNAHIRNCISFLLSGRMLRPGCNGFTNNEWLRIFMTELARRGRYT